MGTSRPAAGTRKPRIPKPESKIPSQSFDVRSCDTSRGTGFSDGVLWPMLRLAVLEKRCESDTKFDRKFRRGNTNVLGTPVFPLAQEVAISDPQAPQSRSDH